MNRKIWKARDEFVQNFEANFPDSFRAVVADYASQFADGTPKHRIKTFEQLLLEKQSERKDDLIRQEGFVAAIATVKAQLRRNALNANAVKSKGNSSDRARALLARDELFTVAPVWRNKVPNAVATEMLKRGDEGQIGGVTGINPSTLRGYISPKKCGTK